MRKVKRRSFGATDEEWALLEEKAKMECRSVTSILREMINKNLNGEEDHAKSKVGGRD